MAEPASTYVTEETYKLTEGLFRFEALGTFSVKGKAKKVKAYRVISPSTSRTRFDVSAERGLTPFIGRERELELLLEGFERAKKGRGQAFSIVAEAGVGKSRLLYEFRKAVAHDDITFQEGKCLSYSRGVAYHPVIDIVKSNFDIAEGDGDSEIRAKLKKGLQILDADEVSTLPYLLEFLSVKDSGVDPRALSPDGRKDRILQALNRVVIKASQIRPLIIAIEDLHWIDTSSGDAFKGLLDSISGARIFLVFTYRPEFVHTWGGKSYHSQVNLNRLSNRESLVMASHLLNGTEIHDDLENFILEKTEGVPFFIEEFIRSLKDLKIIERKNGQYLFAVDSKKITIPSTIQDVIMARVDALPEGEKEIIQIGSVVEREFSHDLIRQITGLSEQELLTRLSVLKDSELLYERGIYPDSLYIFKHALSREVIYDSILTRKREQLHEKTGNAIEEIYKEKINKYYEILVEHYICSNNYNKAADYSKLAERKAEKAVSLNDAILYAKKRISCLEKLPIDKDVEKKIISARTVLGLYYEQLCFPVKAKAAVDPIINLAIKHNYKKRISQINLILGFHYAFMKEDYSKGVEYFEKALETGKELNDNLTIVLGNTWLGVCLSLFGEFEKALSCYERALEINERKNIKWGVVALKMHIATFASIPLGNVEHAYQTSQEALKIANESDDVFSKANANYAIGFSYYLKGFLKEAEDHLLQSVDLSKKSNQLFYAAWANNILSDIYLTNGEYELSLKFSDRAVDYSRQAGHLPISIKCNKISMALARLMNNEININLNKIFKWYGDPKGWHRIFTPNYIIKILLYIDDQHTSEAENWIRRTIETNQKYSMRWHLAQAYALYAELYQRKGDVAKAGEKLSKAIEVFKECGADGWVERYQKELAEF